QGDGALDPARAPGAGESRPRARGARRGSPAADRKRPARRQAQDDRRAAGQRGRSRHRARVALRRLRAWQVVIVYAATLDRVAARLRQLLEDFVLREAGLVEHLLRDIDRDLVADRERESVGGPRIELDDATTGSNEHRAVEDSLGERIDLHLDQRAAQTLMAGAEQIERERWPRRTRALRHS